MSAVIDLLIDDTTTGLAVVGLVKVVHVSSLAAGALLGWCAGRGWALLTTSASADDAQQPKRRP